MIVGREAAQLALEAVVERRELALLELCGGENLAVVDHALKQAVVYELPARELLSQRFARDAGQVCFRVHPFGLQSDQVAVVVGDLAPCVMLGGGDCVDLAQRALAADQAGDHARRIAAPGQRALHVLRFLGQQNHLALPRALHDALRLQRHQLELVLRERDRRANDRPVPAPGRAQHILLARLVERIFVVGLGQIRLVVRYVQQPGRRLPHRRLPRVYAIGGEEYQLIAAVEQHGKAALKGRRAVDQKVDDRVVALFENRRERFVARQIRAQIAQIRPRAGHIVQRDHVHMIAARQQLLGQIDAHCARAAQQQRSLRFVHECPSLQVYFLRLL